ncbi:leucine zipper putative tumor suppressor 2 homolog isoform X1 [Zerene cesonia]|uniref:leucine zipper putative tumor suppressor 2 homolog isoform X1 n=1 Tax=Zerene cesonia TaxID=33412 RepID=UPI0018E4F8EE|nr:leucine zipper putative tumor suppressor 2 homolog isoform X1 [Zerene cesonia]
MGHSDGSPRTPDLPPLPPPIQPCSGFLGNGKSVIRPIAFKPLGGRLSAGGERYGSTPVLASRPPSLMTLYGSSSDVREARWCGSPQPASLSALPPAPLSAPLHQRHHSAIVTKSGSGLGTDSKEPIPAPSPADSGVSELERDQHDYSTTDRLRGHDVRLRAPRLMLQTYRRDARDERDTELARVRRDRALLRQRLEDTEWSLCQRAGEIALLKTQLKDAQNEQTAKGHEYLTLKADCRQLRETVDKKESDITRLRAESEEKQRTIKRLQAEVERLTNDLMASVADLNKNKETSKNEMDKLKTELKELRQELSDVSLSGYEGIECGRTLRGIYECKNEYWTSNESALDAEVQRLNGELPDPCSNNCPANAVVDRLKAELESKEAQFSNERRKWSEEKDKVLRYQKQLQMNYVQMFKRTRTLEAEIDGLRLELELCNKNMKNINQHGKTIEL